MARTVSSSVWPGRTLGHMGNSGLRVSAITAQVRAMASVLSQASGRSLNKRRMSRAGLNQCSVVTRRRSATPTWWPPAMHSRASCASCIFGAAKKHSLVATSGRPSSSARPIRPGSMAASSARPCRCSSIMQRPGNASAMRDSSASASGRRPSANIRAMGPRVPPVSSTKPSAWDSSTSSGNCGSVGSPCMKPIEDRRCRLARPTASCASTTTGSGARRAFSTRTRDIWHPMMGCTPLLAQAWLNSSAPNRLPLSAMATAGILASCARAAILSALIAPSDSE